MTFYQAFISPTHTSNDNELDDIRYHLTKLLESEAPLMAISSYYQEVRRSNYAFGITDVQLLNANLDQAQLAKRLESWLITFEPRLSDVSVEMVERHEGCNAILFTIIARYASSKGKKTLIFDSKIALSDFSAQLSEEDYD
ncbi:GPW/gp25 family protein [Vibrio sp. ZSDZ65]|uniref:GPW/gp25 family protein n=1 Tax=Vibrio qingdaonensis TaxID=2829491 RepID=A0A9X3HUK9_9VIBR|nr:GPW/gp25 family protein [Vibrio qingdaonensis]MCW8344585.1 GPW/gp25 family protein [Vibrio qingdaonensis]